MAEPPSPKDDPSTVPPPDAPPIGEGRERDRERERADRGISDFVRRAVSAGFEAASRSKDDVVRVATTEIRSWLDHLELDTELRKALSNMVLEVKAEIRFRPIDPEKNDGRLTAEVESDLSVKKPGRG